MKKLKIYETGYVYTHDSSTTCSGNTPHHYNTYAFDGEPNFVFINEYTGDEAHSKFWDLQFNDLDTNQQRIIKTVLTKEEINTPNLKMPDKIYPICLGRIFKTDLVKECPRCSGTGHYSYNAVDGTRCFKCGGNKKVLPRLTKKWFKQLEKEFNHVNT